MLGGIRLCPNANGDFPALLANPSLLGLGATPEGNDGCAPPTEVVIIDDCEVLANLAAGVEVEEVTGGFGTSTADVGAVKELDGTIEGLADVGGLNATELATDPVDLADDVIGEGSEEAG